MSVIINTTGHNKTPAVRFRLSFSPQKTKFNGSIPIDCSNENYESQIQVTLETLKEIGAEHVPMIYVFNKTDKLTDKNSIEKTRIYE